MKPRIRKKWIAALRSGKYEQGQGNLNSYGKYCCLGVLADIYYGPDGWESMKEDTFEQIKKLKVSGQIATLPHEMLKHIDLDIQTSYLLANKNDSGSTFLEIADYIEQNL